MTFSNLIRCLRQAHVSGKGYPQMRSCLFNYHFTPQDPISYLPIDIPTSQSLHNDPPIHLYCFTNFGQQIHLRPGLFAVLDGSCTIHNQKYHKMDSNVLNIPQMIEGITETAAVIHISLK